MKITAVEAICLAIPMKPLDPSSSWTGSTRKQIVVRIRTDAGLTGIGEAFAYGAPLAVCNAIEESLAPLIVGQDPLRIEHLVDLMQRATMIWGRRGLGMFAISGIDIALWDLLGKARNAPVYELLGGARRPRLPVYASLMRYDSPKDVAAACTSFVKQGFRMLKLHQTDVESVRAAREAVGPDVELMLDVNCPWTPAEALAMARALAPYRLFWFREIVERRAADILQPSITKVGGITEFRKIAALAQAANRPIAPHSFYFGPGLAATLHMAATWGGSTPVEFPTGVHETSFLANPIQARDGFVEVPQGPGLGVEINEEAMRRHPYTQAAAKPFVLHS